MDQRTGASAGQLEILEGLLRAPAGDLASTLVYACDLVAAATGADKIDAFLYDPSRDSLVAGGTSTQALSVLQRKLGLNVLPLSNGGRSVEVYRTVQIYLNGHVESDAEEIRGIREALKVRSALAVPLEVGGERRGVLLVTSLTPEFFSAEDARMAETVSRWVGLVAHRAELTELIRRNAVEQGRMAGAEELVTVLAHDVRNHLQPLLLRLEALRLRAEREQRADEVEDISVAAKSVRRLSGLVSDLLDVARLDRGVFHVQPGRVDLRALVRESVDTFATPQHPVNLRVQEDAGPIEVVADSGRLRQCLDNLLANAIQKSPETAAVTVVVKRETPVAQPPCAQVEIVDEGPGIPEDILPRIFERYTTGRSAQGGLGLGLYLAKRIAHLHGGDLTVESAPAKGTRFTLTLPAAGSDAAPRAAPAASPRE